MHNSLHVILVLKLALDHVYGWPSHCLMHLRHRQPSTGHHLLHIEHSIDHEHRCDEQCSRHHSCSMATFHRRSHRCHLFQHSPSHSLVHPYRSNYAFTTFAKCPHGRSHSKGQQTHVTNIHCDYDASVFLSDHPSRAMHFCSSLPWQRVQTSRSIIFKSYTLIGTSFVPCQELCSSVRQCAGVQYQVRRFTASSLSLIASLKVRGRRRNQCRLLRSAKPWDLVPSRTWTIYAKHSCHARIDPLDLFTREDKPLCNFQYFGHGQQ